VREATAIDHRWSRGRRLSACRHRTTDHARQSLAVPARRERVRCDRSSSL